MDTESSECRVAFRFPEENDLPESLGLFKGCDVSKTRGSLGPRCWLGVTFMHIDDHVPVKIVFHFNWNLCMDWTQGPGWQISLRRARVGEERRALAFLPFCVFIIILLATTRMDLEGIMRVE